MQEYHSPGKLLISGEYMVLHGAEALAIPCKQGQRMTVQSAARAGISWRSYDEQGTCWLEVNFDTDLKPDVSSKEAERLSMVLKELRQLNPSLFEQSWQIATYLEFPRDWGLGSSSTLLCNLAKWAEVDAFALSERTFGGSGYDIAVGMVESELIYTSPPAWDSFSWNPPFSDRLYFVHLNQKQDSRQAVQAFSERTYDEKKRGRISRMAREFSHCAEAELFGELMREHEAILSGILGQEPVQQRLFSDFNGVVKSLGAWGGDFVMVLSDKDPTSYFEDKGHSTVIPFDQMRKR